MGELWIVVRNWKKFQHYRNRDPIWIKVYTELFDRDEWLNLTLAERGLLIHIWLGYAWTDGQLRLSQVRPKSGLRHFQGHITSLVHAGFITLSASRPLAPKRLRGKNQGRYVDLHEETALDFDFANILKDIP